MTYPASSSRFHRRLVDSLYVEAMLLADEARAYFDDERARNARDVRDPLARVVFACESIKVTTRLMHVIAWLLTQRAVQAGELQARDARDPARRLGDAPVTDEHEVRGLPDDARLLIGASIDLHGRVARFDAVQANPRPVQSPVRSMMDRLTLAF